MAENSDQRFLFEDVFPKPVVARFDGERRTSDAGLSLLAALDRKLGLTDSLARCLNDDRSPARVVHGRGVLLRQRIFSIAVGAPDTNAAGHLAHDPAHMLACGRGTNDLRGLGSQSTLSRFEHDVSGRELVSLQRELEDFAVEKEIASVRKRVNDLALGGRDLRPELVSVEVEDITVWNHSNAFVTTLEIWNLHIYATGTETVLSEELGQRNRVKYQIKRREEGWQVLYRTLDTTFDG
ncbi:MAG: transposase [Acidobacteriota bacterium]